MRLISAAEFSDQMREPLSRPPGELDLSGYLGVHYPCACGRLHTLDSVDYLVREMKGSEVRVVLSCPDHGDDALTLVQLRNGFQTRAMSEVGCRAKLG